MKFGTSAATKKLAQAINAGLRPFPSGHVAHIVVERRVSTFSKPIPLFVNRVPCPLLKKLHPVNIHPWQPRSYIEFGEICLVRQYVNSCEGRWGDPALGSPY